MSCEIKSYDSKYFFFNALLKNRRFSVNRFLEYWIFIYKFCKFVIYFTFKRKYSTYKGCYPARNDIEISIRCQIVLKFLLLNRKKSTNVNRYCLIRKRCNVAQRRKAKCEILDYLNEIFFDSFFIKRYYNIEIDETSKKTFRLWKSDTSPLKI